MAGRKQCNRPSMHKTSAALGVASDLKSKMSKKAELLDTELQPLPVQPWLLPGPLYPSSAGFLLGGQREQVVI